MKELRGKLTYSNVTATLALVVALAGGTTAIAGGFKAPKNSVTSKSIRPGNVTSKDLTRIVSVTVPGQLTDASPGDGVEATTALSPTCPSGGRLVSAGGGGSGTHLVSLIPGDAAATVLIGTDTAGTKQVTANVRCLLRSPGAPQG
jgi:hypothetical protein